MRPLYASLVLIVAGCGSISGVDRHAPATTAARETHAPYALDAVVLGAPRAGQLSASREWERYAGNRTVRRDDDDELRASFARDLNRVLPLDATAPRHVRATLTLQDTGYYEGLAAETTDVTLIAEVLDGDGNLVRTITLREPASAPLQRSASRRQRLQAAFDRLARRLAAQL
jgi:hypothetical protein